MLLSRPPRSRRRKPRAAPDLTPLAEAVDERDRALAELAEARSAMRSELVAARDRGATYRELGDVLGVSRQRVREIVNGGGQPT